MNVFRFGLALVLATAVTACGGGGAGASAGAAPSTTGGSGNTPSNASGGSSSPGSGNSSSGGGSSNGTSSGGSSSGGATTGGTSSGGTTAGGSTSGGTSSNGTGAGTGAAAVLAARLGTPNRLLIGLGSGGSDPTLIQAQGLKPDIYERYLVGIDTQGGWTTWNSPSGEYATIVMQQAASVGAMPMFTLFQFSADNLSDATSLNSAPYMQAYWSDAITLFQAIDMFGKPVLVSVEPDFFGFLQAVANSSYGGDPTKMPAVLSTDPACSAMPPNATGFAPCLLSLARKYAPKAAIGFPPTSWGGPTLASVVTFMNTMGANKGDFLVMQTLDRDAGCREQATLTPATAQADCVGGPGPWYWDETNQTHPNFQDNFAMALTFHNGIGSLPIVWWQTPFGAPSATPGGTAGHYRDNKVDYFLKHPAELVAVGGLGVVFGAGAENQTTPATDGGQYQTLSSQYLANPTPLP